MLVCLDNGAIHSGGETKIVSIDNEPAHDASLTSPFPTTLH